MAVFSYIAIEKNGKEQKGAMEAATGAEVSVSLKRQGLIPIKIKEQSKLAREFSIMPQKKVTPRDLSVFCRQMSSLLNSGVTLIKSLDMLTVQAENSKLKKALEDTMNIVARGETLAIAMRQSPKVFPSILINMVSAGETSGTLDHTFERMAVHFEKSSKLNAMVKKAMIYPIMLCIVAAVVVTVMSVVIVPKFVTLFESMGSELPLVTKIVVAVSNFMIHRWYIILFVLAVIVFAIKHSMKTISGRRFWGNLRIRLPIFGKLTVKNICASFSRTMSTLIATGISLSEALEITARAIDNVVFKEAIENARREIERGTTLSEPLKESGIFPTMVYQMISIGEETGNIEGMLTKVADYYEEEVEISTGTLNAAMEPIIIVVMGIIIGFIAIAIYMPIIGMYDGMGNL